MSLVLCAAFIGVYPSPTFPTSSRLALRTSPPLPPSSVKWTLLTASGMRSELARYDIAPPGWLSESDSFYFATSDEMPAAFLSFSDLHRGRPIANMCGMNRGVLEASKNVRKIWREFEAEFDCMPLFHRETVYFCNDDL